MKLETKAFANGGIIPEKYAFGKVDPETHVTLSDNWNPGFTWSGLPSGTQSLALICHDPDAPSRPDNVNKEGKVVGKEVPRVDFYHWVLVDIPVTLEGIQEGAVSNGVSPKGKHFGPMPEGIAGVNSYTDWFAGDPDMGGYYGGYDGPCPPWNDVLVHHYHFTLFALDMETLGLGDKFTGPTAIAAMEGHILDKARWSGTYSLNPASED